ncbi:hypothetical protein GN244_ATG04515 [Phytophthora infestans]|uniref:Uncharacterized protein n=1 Tax=Phytophthora infestans TaxID=4787 RepID=A0A833WJC6_PHYIN|nr:hypothetical protein GN244_ATG04515 [Phytophthora infestans]KAF4135884.1 hypothetical protein GN958_ATG14870 [Phytophthora infestans]
MPPKPIPARARPLITGFAAAAGEALCKLWSGEGSAEQKRYITASPDTAFPLAENPKGFTDLHTDHRRYLTVVRAVHKLFRKRSPLLQLSCTRPLASKRSIKSIRSNITVKISCVCYLMQS